MNVAALSLTHYSKDPLPALHDADWSARRALKDYKPPGLWVSVDGEDDWLAWCTGESFHLEALRTLTRITLAEDAKVLLLSSAKAIQDFHRTYAGTEVYPRYAGIRWDAVAEKYDGIIIAPYQWSLRLDDEVHWYYGWDCASGCIWRKRAIKEVVPLLNKQAA